MTSIESIQVLTEPYLPLSGRHVLVQLWEKLSRDSVSKIPPLDRWLEAEFKASKKYGKRDRKQIRDSLFYVFRNMESLHTLLAPEHPSSDRAPDELARIVLQQDWQSIVDLAQQLHKPVGASHRLGAFFEPYLLARKLRSNWSEQKLHQFLLRLSEPAELWLRINDFQHTKEEVIESLRAEQIEILEVHDLAVRVRAQRSLYFTQSFENGMFEIQDYASQQIGRAVQASGPEKIWDVCAGAGGKSLQLGTAMRSTGAIFCTDLRSKALDELKKRSQRNALTNIRTLVWDGNTIPELPKAVAKQGGYDVLLVDAPCTSSGTWRRNPEARYRLNKNVIRTFHELQRSILDKVAASLKPGGRLVYSTCSWLVDENEDTVEFFLASDAGKKFELQKMACCGSPEFNSDTMFFAVLAKNQ